MSNKKGISLVILVITIMVMVILASIVVFTTSDTTKNSKIAAFALDLEQLEDLTKEYYLSNNELPVLLSDAYTKATLVSMIDEGTDELSEEITLNGDDSAVFYKLDLSKLPIENTSRGLEENGDNDIFVIAKDSLNIYYLAGEEIGDDYYFSLTEKITGKTKVNNDVTEDDSNINITNTTAAINLTKSTTDFTNTLTVKIDTTLGTNETLEYFIANESIATSTTGSLTVDIASILSSNTTVYTNFYASDDNKILNVNKYNTSSGSNVVVATATVSLSNLDTASGTVVAASSITYKEYDSFILATISGYTDLGLSGIKEARVLYTTKADGSAYYEDLPTTITAEYVYNSGIKHNATTLKLPKDVNGYSLVFVDNAGNISDLGSYTVTY